MTLVTKNINAEKIKGNLDINSVSATTITGTTIFGNASGLTNIPISGVTNLQSSLDNKFDKTGGTVNGNVIVTGNVTILGTATTINTDTLLVKDNIIGVNSNYTGNTAPFFGSSGLEVLRGSATTATLLWEEQYGYWTAGVTGNTKQIIVSGDSLSLLNSGHTHPISEIVNLQSSLDSKFDKSGGIISGVTEITSSLSASTLNVSGNTILNGLSATTISATTYQNLPISALTEGTNISVTGSNGNYTISFTGTTGSNFTGGTVTGGTIYISGLTANTLNVTGNTILNGLTASTISATTYQNLPVSALTQGSNINVSGSNGSYTISFTGGNVTYPTNFTNGLSATTISAETYVNIPYISGANNSITSKNAGNTINGGDSVNFGSSNSQLGSSSALFGTSNVQQGDYSLGFGFNIFGNSDYSLVGGNYNQVDPAANYSYILGYNNSTYSQHSTIFGEQNNINYYSPYSKIFGYQNGVSGYSSFVSGFLSTLNANHSTILGYGMTGYSDHTVYLKKLNVNDVPDLDNTLSDILVRASDGTIKRKDVNAYYSITGITAQTLTMVDNSNNPVFQVIPNTTESLVQINDISGLPAFEVFTNGSIKFGNQPNVLTSYQSLYTTTGVTAGTGTTIIYSLPTTAYTGAFFDYTLLSGTSNLRAGSVVSVWNSGGTSIEFTETSTNDIGTTSSVTFNMSATSSNVFFSASATTSGWTIKTMVRTI